MIIDCHTHVFPPEIARDRNRYVDSDPTFAELYGSAQAKLASADDLLRSMNESGVDVSVALGFAWSEPATCRLHNDYLLEAAASSAGRILPFPTLPLTAGPDATEQEARRCVAAGARGFGELRPENLNFDLNGEGGRCLAQIATELDVPLLFHVTEPAGHTYPGKHGLALSAFYAFVSAYPKVKAIGAHWGGGLPFYASMPEVRALPNLHVDTAASSLLYDDGVYQRVVGLTGAETVLFGSDYPLLSQSRSKRRIEEAGLTPEARDLVLGGNAARLLGLT